MLAQRLPSILPPLDFEEALEVTRVQSAAGLSSGTQLARTRPFRAPHHTVSVAGMAGDARLRPGEISLAHRGVLFLDEAPEFPRQVLEVLRQPLEDGAIRLTRARGSVTWPAALTLVLAANPCPCGHAGSDHSCRCTPSEVHRYLRRMSGPVLDRVDLRVEVHPVPAHALLIAPQSEPSAVVRKRVIAARDRQRLRGQNVPNGQLSKAELDAFAPVRGDALRVLTRAAERYRLSGRGLSRVVKVSRTLADLAGESDIDAEHVVDALALRRDVASTAAGAA